MRFAWPARSHDSHARQAVLVGCALTGLAAAALSPSLVGLYDLNSEASPTATGRSSEVTTYVATIPRVTAHSRDGASAPSPRVIRSGHGTAVVPTAPDTTPPAAAGPRDTSMASDTSARHGPASSAAPTASEARARPIGPVAAPAGLTASRDATLPYMPLRLRTKWKSFMELVRERKPTPAERDSVLKGEDRQRAAARDDQRPLGITLGQIALPFLSRGPSAAQRARDSVVNADYLRRLAVLQARARARQDSLRRADSIARALSADTSS